MKPSYGVAIFFACAALAFGQCTSGAQSPQNTAVNCVSQLFYDGSSNLLYACFAPATNPPTSFYVSSSTLTNIVVSSNVGTINFSSTSYLWVGATIVVSGSATTALNASYKVTAVSGSTATITTAGVSNGTYNDAKLVVTTQSPLLNSLIWAIQAFTYSGSNLSGTYWAGGLSPAVPHTLACSNRSAY